MATTDAPRPAIYFRPQLVIDCYSLRNLPVVEMIAEVKALKEKMREVFPHVADQANLYVKDLYGNLYQLALTMNYHCEDGERIEHNEAIVDIWSPDGKLVFHYCFKLDKEGKLTDTSIMGIRQAMEMYSKGLFTCSECGKQARRFAEGTGYTPTTEVCEECYAKPEVQTKIHRAFQQMSR